MLIFTFFILGNPKKFELICEPRGGREIFDLPAYIFLSNQAGLLALGHFQQQHLLWRGCSVPCWCWTTKVHSRYQSRYPRNVSLKCGTARVEPDPVIFRSVGKEASKQAENLSSSCDAGSGLALGLIRDRTDQDIFSSRVNRENSPDFEDLQAQISALRYTWMF